MDLDNFLENNRLSREEFAKANIDWSVLLDIHNRYQARLSEYQETAEYIVKGMQSFAEVHSVRWRVKDPQHLLEKIIRKRCVDEPSEKYMGINPDNYHEVVSDLVGVRALHLFKDDCFVIHDQVKARWELNEPAVSYVRTGDAEEMIEELQQRNIETQVHAAGYRSVHYVLSTKPGRQSILVELQVRTIFEEAWSEIDHRVRYPNFSDNPQIRSVLKIFNRLSGSADELGGFIRDLSDELKVMDRELQSVQRERDDAIEKMQGLVTQLSEVKGRKTDNSIVIQGLQSQLDKVKSSIKEETVAFKRPRKSRFWYTDPHGIKREVNISQFRTPPLSGEED